MSTRSRSSRLFTALVVAGLSAWMLHAGDGVGALGTTSDLAVAARALPAAAIVGDTITFAISIANNGPDAATNVVLNDTVTGATITGGSAGCTVNPDGTATCEIPSIDAGASAIVNITASVTQVGAVQQTASVLADQSDPAALNNTAVTIAAGVAGIHVGATCTLIDAVNAANSNAIVNGCEAGSAAQPDVIVVPAGVYVFDVPASAGSVDTSDGNALPVVTSDMVIRGDGAATTILQRSAAPSTVNFRLFQVLSGTLTLQGVTLTHGVANRGGAVNLNYFGGAHLVAIDSVFDGNAASQGGAIANGDSILLRSTFRYNHAQNGSVASATWAEIRDSVITGNTAAVGSAVEVTSLDVSGCSSRAIRATKAC